MTRYQMIKVCVVTYITAAAASITAIYLASVSAKT